MINSGIYAIVNTETGDLYIGSAINFKQRRIDHFKTLRSQTHGNDYLQNSFKMAGDQGC